MSEQDGLIGAYILDGKGGGRELDWPTLEQGVAADDRLWVHLDRNGEKSEDWLRMKSGLGQLQADAGALHDVVDARATRLTDGTAKVTEKGNSRCEVWRWASPTTTTTTTTLIVITTNTTTTTPTITLPSPLP